MKRRNFLKSILSIAFIPIIVKEIEPELNPVLNEDAGRWSYTYNSGESINPLFKGNTDITITGKSFPGDHQWVS